MKLLEVSAHPPAPHAKISLSKILREEGSKRSQLYYLYQLLHHLELLCEGHWL